MHTEPAHINNATANSISRKPHKQFEIRALLTLLLLSNLGLLLGGIPAVELVFHPGSILNGEWWRIFTWPFAHVSRYHLLIDGAAFLLLYNSLRTNSATHRIALTLTVIGGSLILPLLVSPAIYQLGLCGLSGPAHGLMAISAMEMRQQASEKKLANLLLLGLLLKTGLELLTGNPFLQQLHLGDIGQPIVTTHAGGMLTGLFCYSLYYRQQKTLFRKSNNRKH